MIRFDKKAFEKLQSFETIKDVYEYSTERYAERTQSRTSDGVLSYTYGSFRKTCEELSEMLDAYGIGTGDKVAILSGNTPNWSIAFFTIASFGRTAVPILPESSENEVANILSHSETRAVFVSRKLLPKIGKAEGMLVIDIDTLSVIQENDMLCRWEKTDGPLSPDSLAAIIYTSGTTGNAKGVMLSHRNLCRNIAASYNAHPCDCNDVWLSILPMAHTYELSLGVLYPFVCGACVNYLGKAPTPSVLMSALKSVRPTVMLAVPLIIEKIYRGSVLASARKNRLLGWLASNAPSLFGLLAGIKLKKAFGGRLGFFGIGGAKLDIDTETFLKRARFPYAIGYGMTETAPLICNAGVRQTFPGTTGIPAYGVQVRLDNADPVTGIGEIVCKGQNVMLGYYKDPERTKAAFTEDGWFRTNDLACIDAKGRFAIKGRLNTVILGPSGENIYPEEIENVINGIDNIEESLVVQRKGRLVALVLLKDTLKDRLHLSSKEHERLKQEIMDFVNRHVSRFSRITDVEFVKEAFEKTATHKIRRMKYCQA